MARQRLAVALIVPQPLATQIDGLRRALGDGALGRIAPHITLVPPTNVAERDLPGAFRVVRAAADAVAPLSLRLGPVTTFPAPSPVAYLAVTGADDALRSLREGCCAGPFDRSTDRDFVPHVTVVQRLEATRLDAVSMVLADFAAEVTVDRVHVLVEQPGRIWVPIADMPLGGGSGSVGRGSLPLEVSVSGRPDLEAASLLAIDGDAPGRPFAVAARRDGAVVAAAWGWTARDHLELADLVVAAAHRNEGIGRHVLAAVEGIGRERSCVAASTVAPHDGAAAALLAGCGWRLLPGRRWERNLD